MVRLNDFKIASLSTRGIFNTNGVTNSHKFPTKDHKGWNEECSLYIVYLCTTRQNGE